MHIGHARQTRRRVSTRRAGGWQWCARNVSTSRGFQPQPESAGFEPVVINKLGERKRGSNRDATTYSRPCSIRLAPCDPRGTHHSREADILCGAVLENGSRRPRVFGINADTRLSRPGEPCRVGRWIFRSEFTHSGATKLTRHPEGHLGLWRDLAGKDRFPPTLENISSRDCAQRSQTYEKLWTRSAA
jgi:hypothetical protein